MPYCPKCGNEVGENWNSCPNCGEDLKPYRKYTSRNYSKTGALGHLSTGFNLAMEKPMVFTPVIIGGLISIIIDNFGGKPFYQSGFSPLLFFAGLMSLIGTIINYILNFAAIDMARDAYVNDPLNLMESINYVLKRIVTFIAASIVGALMSITIVLIPAAILMFVIMVMDETGIMDAISQSFSVLSRDLRDIIVILIIVILGFILLSWVPYIGGLLTAALGVIFDLAFIDVYNKYKLEWSFNEDRT